MRRPRRTLFLLFLMLDAKWAWSGRSGVPAAQTWRTASSAHPDRVATALARASRFLLIAEPVDGMGVEETQRMIGAASSLTRGKDPYPRRARMDAVFSLAGPYLGAGIREHHRHEAPQAVRANEEVRRRLSRRGD